MKNQYIEEGGLPKKEGLEQFSNLMWWFAKNKGVVFLKGVGTPMHNMNLFIL